MRPGFAFRDHRTASTGPSLVCGGLTAVAAFALLPLGSIAQQLPSATPTAPATVPAQTQAAHPQHHSQVTLDHGRLTVVATNASLNGLIREIARQTGMKITGSVAEDRVFGTYGPDDPQRILATLLDGTGTNILIRSSAADAPLQLILTPRTGAATPPNPNANVADNDADDDQTPPPGAPTVVSAPRARSTFIPGNVSAPPPSSPPSSNGIAPASETVVFPAPDATSTPSTATTTPADTAAPSDSSSSDAVKTPQQIFEQLQKLRQQSNGTPAPQ